MHLGIPTSLGCSFLKVESTCLQDFLRGVNTPMSSGWSLSVELGGRQTKEMLFSLHSLMMLGEMWLARLSPMMSFFTRTSLQPGKSQLHKLLFIEEHVDSAILAAIILAHHDGGDLL
jgi:hypothetical protein